MNNTWEKHLESSLSQLAQQQLLRQRGSSWKARTNQFDWLDFGSNDYLGLSQSGKVIEALQQSAGQGWGSGASPVLSGYGQAHQQLEQSLAGLSGTENALVFSSGFACNVGSLAALADEDCVVFSDQLNHASLIDGLRLSRALREVYPHNDTQALEKLLSDRRSHRSRALIVTESVFSMDGDEAPLRELADLADRFDCGFVVDEAHAIGVFGSGGGGLLEELALTDRVLLKLGTLSKAIGGIGGYVAGSSSIIDYMVNRCRSYIFSTAMPTLAAIATLAAVDRLKEMQSERQRLAELSSYARQQLLHRGWHVPAGRSPILPVIVGEASSALALSRHLLENGIYVPAIRPPTVPASTCRLRISLSTEHTCSDIDRLVSTLGQYAR
jgi:8-amino-7-oxononanoate synthase